MKVSQSQHCGYYIHPYYRAPPPYPIAITVHQCSKMPQSHCLSSLCNTVFPVIPPSCVLIIIPLNPLLPPFTPTILHLSSLVMASPFLEFVSLLLFCSFSFALLLYLTNEGNHLVFVFLCLTYFTEHNTLQLHPCCCKW